MMDLQFTKICFKCGKQKEKKEFYKHPKMSDGFLGKCKECTKNDVKIRTEINTSTPEGLAKERLRHREKYKRLNYKDKQKVWDKNKPWKNSNIYKGLNKKFKIPKGFELHHWNYNNDFLTDVMILKIKEHRQAHTHLVLDEKLLIFKTKDGYLLNSRAKHIAFLIDQGINF